jgi:RimJ/RimL family protein N-acetyltransferase
MLIRLLAPEDAESYVALRREMLEDSPWAFAAGPGDDQALNAAIVVQRISEPGQAIVGAWEPEGALIGAAGVYRPSHTKMAHRAHLWGVYVTPRARGRGIGARILARALEVARSWPGVTSVGLSVSTRSVGARRLYERLGFRAWGAEPGALVVDGVAYDEVHMVAVFEGLSA